MNLEKNKQIKFNINIKLDRYLKNFLKTYEQFENN